jgi:hypothetical protein
MREDFDCFIDPVMNLLFITVSRGVRPINSDDFREARNNALYVQSQKEICLPDGGGEYLNKNPERV